MSELFSSYHWNEFTNQYVHILPGAIVLKSSSIVIPLPVISIFGFLLSPVYQIQWCVISVSALNLSKTSKQIQNH
jgi:hypothetical protein